MTAQLAVSDLTAILINSRGNPEKLTATCVALAGLAARPELVRFCIRADADDTETIAAIGRLGHLLSVNLTIGPRPISLGAEVNRMAANIEAGFYHVFNDDVIPLTVNWDLPQLERRALEPDFVSCWTLAPGPTAPDYPIVSRKWLDAAGSLFTEHYPYWFDDMDLANRYLMVKGKVIDLMGIGLHARKTKTQRMRDFGFWFSFFRSMEGERIAWAKSIAENLGLPEPTEEWIERTRMGDIAWFERKKELETERKYSDPSEPDPAYLSARAKAQSMMGVAA